MKNPWSKFYWADWRSDPRLRMCCLAARGLWMEMLALMHEAEPYGHLVVSGNAPTDVELGVLAGAPPSQIPELLGELERVGVFSRTRKGTIYSRRMLRDEKKAATAVKNGKGGGNPTLCSITEISPSDNPRVILPDKPQKLEARIQTERKNPPQSPRKRGEDEAMVFNEFWESWPHKVGIGQARPALRKALKKAALEDIIAGVHRYVKSKPEDRAWCNPATFLNGERWTDQPVEIQVTNGHGKKLDERFREYTPLSLPEPPRSPPPTVQRWGSEDVQR